MILLAIVLCVILQCYTIQGDNFQSTLGHLTSQTNASIQARTVEDLIRRLVPNESKKFIVIINPKLFPAGKDGFQLLLLKNGTLQITGTTGVAAASGFHHYLKYYIHAHVSWEGNQLKIPQNLPKVNLLMTLNDRFRYYQNVCTTSYSFVWWDWPKWEEHIDWMALNSFNLVLASHGQEAIWERVYKNFGMTDHEIQSHFAGPAFLSWSRMGNIRGWGGPLSTYWHTRSLTLQKQILGRMRDFGMIPILPAFSGHVPRAFSRLFPGAKMTKVGKWNYFNDTYCCPYLLDPTDPVFQKVGSAFLTELTKEFGTNHVYNCDTFNEMQPPTSNLTYLDSVGKSIYKAMTTVDPQAIWLLQGWMFYSENQYWKPEDAKAFLRSIPLGKMIVLDLQSEQFPQYERLESYFGQPYIWCMLHNFGGTSGMLGSTSIINTEVFKARLSKNSTMVGTGLTMEGINQNYVIYDLMTEMSWRKTPADLKEWFTLYTGRRYGKNNTNADAAWQILKDGIYNFSGIEKIRGKYVITRSPSTKIITWSWYNTSDVYKAWDQFLMAGSYLNGSTLYSHDLVDLTRQVLQNLGDFYYRKIEYAYKNRSKKKFSNYSSSFLEIFDDLEDILSTNDAFLLGPWLNTAKTCAQSDDDIRLFEYNARNQITLWGPYGEIKDYANKQWSGLVVDYYKPRWKLFLKIMGKSLKNFNEDVAKRKVFKKVERPFTFDRKIYPDTSTGDPLTVSRKIHQKWWPILQDLKLVS